MTLPCWGKSNGGRGDSICEFRTQVLERGSCGFGFRGSERLGRSWDGVGGSWERGRWDWRRCFRNSFCRFQSLGNHKRCLGWRRRTSGGGLCSFLRHNRSYFLHDFKSRLGNLNSGCDKLNSGCRIRNSGCDKLNFGNHFRNSGCDNRNFGNDKRSSGCRFCRGKSWRMRQVSRFRDTPCGGPMFCGGALETSN